LAEFLNGDISGIVPKMPLDPAWVRACISGAKGSTEYDSTWELAAWALTHCADEDLQCEILRSSKKKYLWEAVLSSPYLTNGVRARMQEELAGSERPSELVVALHYRSMPTLREQFEMRLADDTSFFEHKDWFITSLKSNADLKEDDYVRLVKRGLKLKVPWIINAILFGSFCLDHMVVGASGSNTFERAMVIAFDKAYDLRESQVIKAYKLLDDKSRRDFLDEVVPRLHAGGARHPLGLFFAQEISRLGSCSRPRAGSSVGKSIFTDDAMDFLVADGAYTHLAIEHELSDEQFLVALKSSDVKARMLIYGARNEARVLALIAVLESQHSELGLELGFKECAALVSLCKYVNDPVVARVFAIADSGGRSTYLRGEWLIEPAIAALENELSRKDRHTRPIMQVHELINAKVSPEYRQRYLELVEGAAFVACSLNEDLADYVWGRLEASTTNHVMAVTMFSQHPEQALGKMCATLKRLDEAP
jgi:hypothetical protein